MQSVSSYTHIVPLSSEIMNMFSEMDLKRLIIRLVDLFAQLQRANIAHRNIKPANLVFSSNNKQGSGR